MSSALTFYFKEIFPNFEKFKEFLNRYNVVDVNDNANLLFAQYVFKVLFRRYCNSNVQYDTIEDFCCDFANVLEDNFDKYKRQYDIIKEMYKLTVDELAIVNKALANNSVNPNTELDDPTKPLNYISAQAFSYTTDNKVLAFMRALENMPTKLIDSLTRRCVNLFKTILPNQIFVFKEQ